MTENRLSTGRAAATGIAKPVHRQVELFHRREADGFTARGAQVPRQIEDVTQ